MLKLYSYFRSSAAYRVRIALNIKNLSHEYVGVHLVRDGGEQRREDYRAINPMAHVPAIDHDGFRLAESMAIFEYLDALQPAPPLFPTDARTRARVWQVCEMINSGIQPLVNLKVTHALEHEFRLGKDDVARWTKHWLTDGLANLERALSECQGRFTVGDALSAADCALVPQCFSARRFGIDVSRYPRIERLDAALVQLPAFAKAHPNAQPDSE